MKNLHSLIIMSLSAVALGGCAVSSGALSSGRDVSTAKAIEARALPVSSMAGASEGALVANSGKFAKSKDQSLTLADANKSFEEIDAEFQQAYAVASNQFVPISTEHADLKPYVGRWTLEAKAARGGMQRVGSYQGLSSRCELVLEDLQAGNGYKASGSSACPTGLFMLDSWVAFDGRLVLRDHMGDDIVKLRSEGSGVWVGVNKEGNVLVLKKS